MISYTDLLSLFPGKKDKRRNDSCNVICPCHNDGKPSLTITKAKDRYLFHCQAGCETEAILEAVGLKWSDIGPSKEKPTLTWRSRMEYGLIQRHGEGTHIVAVYDYKDADGCYLFSKIRVEGGDIKGKDFIQARIDYAANQYEYNLGGRDPTLYQLPELLKAIRDGFPVYIVEGEKDVLTLKNKLHYTATTAGAAGGWKKKYARYFKGASVTIIPDNDEPGEKMAAQICSDLKDYAFGIRIVSKISSLPKGDVTDFFDKENKTVEDFKGVLNSNENEYHLASWAYKSKSGEFNVKPSSLALHFSKLTDYIIVRNPIDDNDLFYGYVDGVYQRWNKAQIKGALREFVPVCYQKDAQIAEAFKTIFELGRKVHSFEELDADERYINFRNGLYDINKNELIPHDPRILSTLQLNYDYDPSARECPVFTKYMNDLLKREDGSVDYDTMKIVQEYSGLVISNIYVYRAKRALFFCSYRGNTGKTQFMNLTERILGEDHVTSIPIQHMNENSGRFTMGTAIGKRMIINGDQTESDVGDSSYFKQLTGGDRTKMENKNQKALMVRYRGGIMIGCNGLPSFTDDKGEHIFDRILLVMCTNVIPEDRRDPELLDKMEKEIPAIINWMLDGLQRLIANGLKFSKSDASEAALKEYRSQLDTVYRFIQENKEPETRKIQGKFITHYWRFVITKDLKDQFPKTDFYTHYNDWCSSEDIDVTPVKKKNLNQRLEALGCKIDPRGTYGERSGVYTIRGMKYINSITGDSRILSDEELLAAYQEKVQTGDEESQVEAFLPCNDSPFKPGN